MMDEFKSEEEQIELEEKKIKKRNELIKKFTDLLLECDKDYKIETWASAEGIDIITHGLVRIEGSIIEYPIKISVHNNSYIDFEVDDELEDFIIKRDKIKKEKENKNE